MVNSKLLSLYQTLNTGEAKQLIRFLESPFHNQRQDVIKSGYFLLKSTNPIDREIVFKAVYPEKDFSLKEMRHLMNYLYDLIKQFLVVKHSLAQPENGQKILIDRLNKGKNEKVISSELKSYRKMLERQPYRELDYHLHLHHHALAAYNATAARSETIQMGLQEGSDALDIYFILSKLKMAVTILAHKRLFQVDYHLGFLKTCLAVIEEKQLLKIPTIRIYYEVYQTFIAEAGPDELHFRSLSKELEVHAALFPPDEIRSLYLLAINFGIRQINQGRKNYIQEIFTLYQKALEQGVLTWDGEISPWTFSNIVSTALKIKQLDWIERFLEQYTSYLPEGIAADLCAYNTAKLRFAQARYPEVVRVILTTPNKDVFIQLDCKVLLIQAYIEIQDIRSAEYQLDNLNRMLRRKEVLTYHKKNFRNFIRYVKRILSLDPSDEEKRGGIAGSHSGGAAIVVQGLAVVNLGGSVIGPFQGDFMGWESPDP